MGTKKNHGDKTMGTDLVVFPGKKVCSAYGTVIGVNRIWEILSKRMK